MKTYALETLLDKAVGFQLEKNLMKRFKILKSVDFRPRNDPITHFENNTNFLKKPKQSLLPTH